MENLSSRVNGDNMVDKIIIDDLKPHRGERKVTICNKQKKQGFVSPCFSSFPV
jgi:hypothetical protein